MGCLKCPTQSKRRLCGKFVVLFEYATACVLFVACEESGRFVRAHTNDIGLSRTLRQSTFKKLRSSDGTVIGTVIDIGIGIRFVTQRVHDRINMSHDFGCRDHAARSAKRGERGICELHGGDDLLHERWAELGAM
jgi:hypothetical protein